MQKIYFSGTQAQWNRLTFRMWWYLIDGEETGPNFDLLVEGFFSTYSGYIRAQIFII